MELSRKSKKELAKLKRGASELWDDQKEVLEQAIRVVREAKRQLAQVGREDVLPRVRETYESRIRPGFESGMDAGRQFLGTTREKLAREVLPNISTALGTALAALEVVKNPRVRQALGKVAKAPSKAVPAPKSTSALKFILMGIGVVAAAGVAYAAWQTLRADDELWVSPDVEPGDTDEL
ncbi:MAG: hypothetical protein KF844_00150 [Cryobacterium sp.]|nr:hypothetical protein [Cryobacterium sp.]